MKILLPKMNYEPEKRGRIILVGVVGLNISRAEFYEHETRELFGLPLATG